MTPSLTFVNLAVSIAAASCAGTVPSASPQCSNSSANSASLLQRSVAKSQIRFEDSDEDGNDFGKKKRAKRCFSWCAGKRQSWSKKCKWKKCGGCFPCKSGCDDATCMGNGECVSYASKGFCKCDEGWKGEHCNILDLLPVRRSSPGFAKENSKWVQSWGGGIVHEGNAWRAILGAKKDPKGSDQFGDNTHLIGLESNNGPGGPFTVRGSEPVSSADKSKTWIKAGEPLAPSGFRVDMKKTSDGTLLFVSSGYASHTDETKRGFGFTITFSKNGMDGPWEEICVYKKGQAIDGEDRWTWPASSPKAPQKNYRADAGDDNYARRFDCEMSDPTFVELEDGSAIIGYRGTQCAWDYENGDHFQEVPAFLVAKHWSGPYKRMGVKVLGDTADAEDMYMWKSPRGVHMLYHHMGKEHGELYKKLRGGYAFTPDKTGLGSWKTTDVEAWDTYLAMDDCDVLTLGKRQRPSFVFDDTWKKPTHLVTGVSTTTDGITWGDGWTAVQPLRGASPPTGGACSASGCPQGHVGRSGKCVTCSKVAKEPLPSRCAAFATQAGKCICAACKDGWLGDACQYAKSVQGSSCWKFGDGSGKRLKPGTANDKYFRCGWMENGKKKGYHGHCVPIGSLCNGLKNCGDNTDEKEEHCGKSITCSWPLVAKGGACSACEDKDIGKCEPGQVVRLRSSSSCECLRCKSGFVGKLCDIKI